jgi:hypothetical protein
MRNYPLPEALQEKLDLAKTRLYARYKDEPWFRGIAVCFWAHGANNPFGAIIRLYAREEFEGKVDVPNEDQGSTVQVVYEYPVWMPPGEKPGIPWQRTPK